MKIINPATEQVIADLPEDRPATVAEKYDRARAAQPAWAATPLERRLDVIRGFRERLAARRDELALVLTREMGKPITQSRNELNAMQGRLDFFLRETAAVLGDEVVHRESDAGSGAGAGGALKLEERIAHEPLGVITNVSAWNYPYFVGSNVFVPALLAGNTVLYKPSEHATMTGLKIGELLHESGVPEDAFATLVGAGDIGAAAVAQPVDGVFFTGSYGTGRRLAEAVGGRLIKVQLELGGKDPVYVCDDVDVRAAAESLADGAMYNAGQSCCAVERLYVHERIAEPFIAAFVETARGFPLGDPEDEKTYLGPLARKPQLEVLRAQIDEAISKNARLLLGGRRPARPGYYFEATVLSDVTHAMALMRDETFGPAIGIMTVRDDDEAARLMNDTEYGLTAGVYARDRARAEAILRKVNAGSVYWNCCDRVSPRLPWTGRKHSGIGSTLSTYGIRTFLQPKAWHLRTP